jgi:hypothetical protein
LPALVEQKLTKTGYTRGASLKEIFQNRVTRNNTVLIDLAYWEACRTPDDGSANYENGFIVLVEPSWYFETVNADVQLAAEGLELGMNALLLFRKRADWMKYAPAGGSLPNGRPFEVATARRAPLGGTYFTRIHATVAATDGRQLVRGFNDTALRGAGIRVYEYASTATIAAAKLQLEALLWLCHDADDAMKAAGMSDQDVKARKAHQLKTAEDSGLLDYDRLVTLRMVDQFNQTICPLCKERLSAADFFKRGAQAEGREVYDLTATEISLFHIQELRVGKLQHKVYNLGWGHHFCNVVVKDAGIIPTLQWMRGVLINQGEGSLDLSAQAESVEGAVEG